MVSYYTEDLPVQVSCLLMECTVQIMSNKEEEVGGKGPIQVSYEENSVRILIALSGT